MSSPGIWLLVGLAALTTLGWCALQIALHVTELRKGWMGKVNALCRGMERARGDYVLFTDADVHFSPGSLRAAISLAVSEGLDHLTIVE